MKLICYYQIALLSVRRQAELLVLYSTYAVINELKNILNPQMTSLSLASDWINKTKLN